MKESIFAETLDSKYLCVFALSDTICERPYFLLSIADLHLSQSKVSEKTPLIYSRD